MNKKKLHPSVEQFKSFVNNHPKLLESIQKKEYSLQSLYEDWYLLGEEDPKWNRFKSGDQADINKKVDDQKNWVDQVTGLLKKMDAAQLQHVLNNVSQAVGAVQGVLSQFQGQANVAQKSPNPGERHPFSFRKD